MCLEAITESIVGGTKLHTRPGLQWKWNWFFPFACLLTLKKSFASKSPHCMQKEKNKLRDFFCTFLLFSHRRKHKQFEKKAFNLFSSCATEKNSFLIELCIITKEISLNEHERDVNKVCWVRMIKITQTVNPRLSRSAWIEVTVKPMT